MYSPNAIVSSTEIKAQETAQIVASQLNVIEETREGLHEHERGNCHWASQELFEKRVAEFFCYPQKLVMGDETAEQTSIRFACAVDRVVSVCPGGNVAIVTHGTVIALYISCHLKVDAFPFWKRLGLPSYVVLSLPEMKLDSAQFSL